MQVFVKRITDLIKRKAKELRQKKLQVIERIKAKDITGTCFDYSKHGVPINNCTNSKKLVEKEAEIVQEIENLSCQSQADEDKRKKQEEKNERLRKEEEEEQQKYQKKMEEEQKKFEEERNQNSNNPPKNNEKLNDLKTKFHEIYQKGKKYSQFELSMLLHTINEISKETILDNDFWDAKTELQSIWDKLAPYQREIYIITVRGEKVEDMLKGVDKYQLENCKKAFEETAKIIYLSEREKHFLSAIENKLKILNLESEIGKLENQNKKTENPQQKKESQEKIDEKKKELDKVKEEQKKRENNPPPKIPQNEENNQDNYQN
jgi:hypothetical protein